MRSLKMAPSFVVPLEVGLQHILVASVFVRCLKKAASLVVPLVIHLASVFMRSLKMAASFVVPLVMLVVQHIASSVFIRSLKMAASFLVPLVIHLASVFMRSLKMASDKLPPVVPLMALFVSTCLMTTNASPVCQTGTKRYYNQAINERVCCWDIQCDRGEQPIPCNRTSPIPTCLPCSEHTYQALKRHLSDGRPYRNCRAKTNCDFYLDKGTTTTNAKCGCPPGKFLNGDGICLPRPACPPGEGQTIMGSCERCVEGKTFSDKWSFTEHCMPVTKCEANNKCTLSTSTIISDNKCGPKTSDLRQCNVTVPTDRTRNSTTSIQPTLQSPSGSLDTGKKVGIGLSVVVIAVIIGLAVYLVWQGRQQQRNLLRHRIIAWAVSKAADAERVLAEVYQLVENYLVEEESKKWQPLGKLLLKSDFSSVECDIKSKNIPVKEEMWEMLNEWKQRCRTNGPDLDYLFDCMYSPANRKTLKFKPLAEKILEKYGTTLGVTNGYPVHRQPLSCNVCCRIIREGSEFSSGESLVPVQKMMRNSDLTPDDETHKPLNPADDGICAPSVLFPDEEDLTLFVSNV